ncbi:organic cation transporter protein isoform X2 [Diachasma alloeum]|uniref:organic cation transporter protein isoform X2 n=1 Tax=Diachasma alloeum TaxID=454923 RepID=UPI0007381E50|nr:organic cation transporter protein isoform X2 [Diachasma alloeum]
MIKMSTEETRVGCFQVLLLFLLAINCIIVAMSHALPAFHNYTPRFYCESSDQGNRSYGCVRGEERENSTAAVGGGEFCQTEYIFEADRGEKSVVTDWGLVCERSYLRDLANIVYYVGVSIGALIAGVAADRVGRLPVLAVCLYAQGTMAVATYIVQSYPVFLGLRGLQGIFAQGLHSATYVLILELFPTKFRTLIFTVMGIAWSLGLLLLAGLSYIILDWRILQLAVSVPTAITVLYVGIIPESPRWLLAKGKTTEADMALEKITKYNACCCGGKVRRELVADNSENTTPVKPTRKSQVFSDTKDITESEAVNLLTPTNSAHRNSRRISLRAISENLEKRLSNLTPETSAEGNNGEVEFGESSTSRSNRNSKACTDETIVNDTGNGGESNDATSIEVDIKPMENHLSEESQVNEDEETEKLSGISESSRSTNLFFIKYSGVVALQWFSTSLANAIVLKSLPNLLENRHINFAVGGIIELAIYLVIYFILSRHGRRLPLGIFQSLNSMICIVIAGLVFLPRLTAFWIGIARTTLLLLGRVTTTSTVGTVYLYTVEIFPTVLRATCLGVFTVFGTIGYLGAPYISAVEHCVPMGDFMLAALLCLIAGLSCLVMPETVSKALPDTIKDAQRLTIGEDTCNANGREDAAAEREILREKLFSEDWVDAGNGIIVNFTENKN